MNGRTRVLSGTWIVAVIWFALQVPDLASAQTSPCRQPRPLSVGFALGRSLPYLEVDSGGFGPNVAPFVTVRAGTQIAGRVDVPFAGVMRLRLEGGAAWWNVRGRQGAAAPGLAGDESAERIVTRHLVGLVGVGMGSPPVCAHVSAGGGFHAIEFPRATLRRPGVTLAAGIEIPTGRSNVIQLDAAVHLVATGEAQPVSTTAVPVLSLLVGWSHRF